MQDLRKQVDKDPVHIIINIINNPQNPKEFWRVVNYLTKNQHTILYLIDQVGNQAHSGHEKLTC